MPRSQSGQPNSQISETGPEADSWVPYMEGIWTRWSPRRRGPELLGPNWGNLDPRTFKVRDPRLLGHRNDLDQGQKT